MKSYRVVFFTGFNEWGSMLSDAISFLRLRVTEKWDMRQRILEHNDTTICMSSLLLIGDLPLSRIDRLDDVVRWSSVHGAPDALSGAQDLLHAPGEVFRERLWPHRPCDLDDLVAGNVARVLDVLLLLAVPWRLWWRVGKGKGKINA